MSADKDIVERLQSAGHFYAPPHDAILYEAAAEIVRLRGEVAALLEDPDEAELVYRCGDPDSDAIAPAEAKATAPAMPNGVEYDRELIARMLEAARRSTMHQFSVETWEGQIAALRAADNRDAARVWRPIETAPKDNARPLYLARFNPDTGELQGIDWDGSWEAESEGWEMPQIYYVWKSAHATVDEPTHWAYQDEPIPPTSSAVPAGEAVAWMHGVCADDGEEDQALSFSPDNFPLEGVAGYRKVWCRPLIYGDTHPPAAEVREWRDKLQKAVSRNAGHRCEYRVAVEAVLASMEAALAQPQEADRG